MGCLILIALVIIFGAVTVLKAAGIVLAIIIGIPVVLIALFLLGGILLTEINRLLRKTHG